MYYYYFSGQIEYAISGQIEYAIFGQIEYAIAIPGEPHKLKILKNRSVVRLNTLSLGRELIPENSVVILTGNSVVILTGNSVVILTGNKNI